MIEQLAIVAFQLAVIASRIVFEMQNALVSTLGEDLAFAHMKMSAPHTLRATTITLFANIIFLIVSPFFTLRWFIPILAFLGAWGLCTVLILPLIAIISNDMLLARLGKLLAWLGLLFIITAFALMVVVVVGAK